VGWEAPQPEHSIVDAVCLVTGAEPSEVEALVRAVPNPLTVEENVLYGSPDASEELLTLAYVLCRLLRPQAVVETGVAYGFTSAAILAALAENGAGRLLSVDLPHLHLRAGQVVGAAVAPQLRDRWKLSFGPSRRVLPGVLADAGEVGLFVQDGSHLTAGQLYDYRTAWPHIAPGGVLLTDDIGPAFELFAWEVGVAGVLVHQSGHRKELPLGVLAKPAGTPVNAR